MAKEQEGRRHIDGEVRRPDVVRHLHDRRTGPDARVQNQPPNGPVAIQQVGEIALKDVILPGEMRDILNSVVAAEKEAQANIIRRREETAATRSPATPTTPITRAASPLSLHERASVSRASPAAR